MTDNPAWLRRAHQNPRGVGSVLYLPSEFTEDALPFETGINLTMRRRQFYAYREMGRTFRRLPVVTVRGMSTSAQFERFGMKEATAEVLDTAKAKGVYVGGRLVDKADAYRLWVSFSPVPKGWLGGTIGIDNYALKDGTNPEYPWPGRTGLQGKGLDLLAFRTVDYTVYTHEGHADEGREWEGALAHEILVHCLRGMPHASWEEPSISNGWWGFTGYPAAPLLPRERAENIKSPFLR
jgi:uncharacterized protein (DUF3820 family)